MNTTTSRRYLILFACFALLTFGLVVSTVVLSPAATAQTVDFVIDWETDADGNELLPGQIIDDEFHTTNGVSITVITQSDTDVSTIFDSSEPSADPDSGTPNETCGGLGVGAGGEVGQPGENCTAQENILIIPLDKVDADNDGFIDVPDVDGDGGLITLIFSEPVNPQFVGLLDQEDQELVTIRSYQDAAGTTLLDSTMPQAFGNNSFQRVRLDITGDIGARRIEFDFSGSGAITSIAYTTREIERDFGDLPATYNNTVLGNDGARHIIGDLVLGQVVDPEPDGQESPATNGDDTDGSDDEDGVTRVATSNGRWIDGQNGGTIDVQVSGGKGCLSGWIDWDENGNFTDPGDQILNLVPVDAATSPNRLQFDVPVGTFGTFQDGPDLLFNTRFRLVPDFDADGVCTDETAIGITGSANGGEVEDYQWSFTPTAITLSSVSAASSAQPRSVGAPLVIALVGLGILGAVTVRRRRNGS